MICVFGIVVALVFLIVIFGLITEQNETKIEEKLIAFNDGQGIKGNFSGIFFVGHGTIDSVSYYFMYAENSDGGIKQLRVRVDNAVIYEEDRKDGLLNGCEIRNGFGNLNKDLTKYVIHVPKGTVIRQFKADLE